MKRRSLFIVLLSLATVCLVAQVKDSLNVRSSLGLRYMSTNNRGDLTDFRTMVAFGQVKADYQLNDWLGFSGQVNGVFLPAKSSLEKRDAITGRGSLYESNLFNLRTMSGQAEFALPILNAQINRGGHILTVGRFLKNAQAFRPEQWPFPNALEGIWYENYRAENTSWQLAVIHKAMPRFSGDFETIGNSIGVAGSGVNPDGSASAYSGNVKSNVLLVGNYNKLFSNNSSLDVWNYFIEGVMNTVLVEPKIHFPESRITLSTKLIYQGKIGDGGNPDSQLAYKTDDKALYLGLRAEKIIGKHSWQLNLSRISNDGRFLMPREWGFEPFYTFQRRTRVEGVQGAFAVMLKWQANWATQQFGYQLSSSIANNKLPDVNDYARNKYQMPSHIHWDASIKVRPVKYLTGLTLEALIAYRFLTDSSVMDKSLIINNANFLHTDIRMVYSF